MTDPLDILRTHPDELDRDQALRLAVPERLPDLLPLLEHEDEQVVLVTAQVLGVLGSEEAVPALAAAGRRNPDSQMLQALADCGPRGRDELEELGREPGRLGLAAVLALTRGLARRPLRPALYRRLANVAASATNERIRDFATLAVALGGWVSGLSRLPDELELVAGLRLDPAATPAQQIPLPYVAAVRRRNREAMVALSDRREEVRQAFLEHLDRLQQAAPEPPSAGRNDPCPCGSGRKFKKCCLDRRDGARRAHSRAERCREAGEDLVGFVHPPTSEPLLDLLGQPDPSRLQTSPGDPAPVRWAAAFRLLALSPSERSLEALLQVLDRAPDPDLDPESILLWMAVGLADRPALAARVIPAAARLSEGPALAMLATVLARAEGDELTELLHQVLAHGRGVHAIMSVLEAAMDMEQGPDLAEEAIPFLRHAEATEALEAVREWVQVNEWTRPPSIPDLPPEAEALRPALEAVARLPREALEGEDLSRLAARIQLLAAWPEGEFEDLAEDSRAPVEEERAARRRLAAGVAGEFAEALGVHAERLDRRLAEGAGAIFLILAGDELVWTLPQGADLETASTVAAAAGILAAELGLGLPRAAAWGPRVALRQAGLAGHEADVGVAARVALEECFAAVASGPPETVLAARPDGLPEAPPAPLSEADPVLLEKARRAGLHPLELAAERSAQGRPLPVSPRRPAPLRAAPAVVAPPEPAGAGVDPPVPLAEDPVPARKALRRVLRRLFRLGKIGESHTAVDLVSRGVAGHLRGQVKDSVDLLLARGLLRDKPTLVGQHTSIEPLHVPAIERFIAEGWLPHPDLARTLDLPSAREPAAR